MAKQPKSEPEVRSVLECDVSVEQIDKAIKHLQGRLRQMIVQAVFTTGEAGTIARTAQDLQALGMIEPLRGSEVTPEKPKALSKEEAIKQQRAAQAYHQAEEDLDAASR